MSHGMIKYLVAAAEQLPEVVETLVAAVKNKSRHGRKTIRGIVKKKSLLSKNKSRHDQKASSRSGPKISPGLVEKKVAVVKKLVAAWSKHKSRGLKN